MNYILSVTFTNYESNPHVQCPPVSYTLFLKCPPMSRMLFPFRYFHFQYQVCFPQCPPITRMLSTSNTSTSSTFPLLGPTVDLCIIYCERIIVNNVSVWPSLSKNKNWLTKTGHQEKTFSNKYYIYITKFTVHLAPTALFILCKKHNNTLHKLPCLYFAKTR